MGLSIFEWIAEKFNPGPVGTIDRNEEDAWQPQSRFLTWLLTLLGIGLFSFFIWGILKWENKWLAFLSLVIYLLLAWSITPKPAHQNMGWFGGLIDHPFRISDDFNRWLFIFALVLLPGKIILFSFQTILNTIRAL